MLTGSCIFGRNKLSLIYGIFSFGLIACKKFVQINPPETQLAGVSVFSSNASANAAQLAIYSQSPEMSYNFSLLPGFSADELINYNVGFPDYVQFYTNNLTANTGTLSNIWSTSYSLIYDANSVIEGVSGSTLISANVKQDLLGEAEFVRAFYYFYLVNLFGDIPLITSTDYSVNANMPRTPKNQVYQKIVFDLKDCQEKLSSNYVGADGLTLTTERLRPNKWAASSLLARVYLYTGAYDSAEAQSDAVISQTGMFGLTGLDSVFLKNSTEAIWQVTLGPTSLYNTIEGESYILTTTPSTSALSSELLSSFEDSDSRRTNWVDSVTVGSDTYYYPFKYKIASAPVIIEYTMVLRLAEQYLIRAEARSQQHNILGANGALADLNVIRKRAGLPDYSGFSDPASVLNAILHERQVELFTEWGHRWLDLKRTTSIDSVMTRVTPLKGGGNWRSNQQLYPILQTDRSSDPNLSQNAGY